MNSECSIRGYVLKGEDFRSFARVVTAFPLQDIRDLGSQNRHLVRDDIPHDVIIHTEVPVDQAISHPCRCSPIDVGIMLCNPSRRFLNRFPYNLEAAHEGPLQSLIALELLPTNPRDARRQIIRFIQYMAKLLKRRAYSATTEPPIMPETSRLKCQRLTVGASHRQRMSALVQS